MSDYVPAADPKRPYKTYAAIASAFIASFLATNATDLPPWAVGLLTAVVAALAVFITPNPIVGGTLLRRDDHGVTSLTVVILVAAAVAVLCVLVVIPALR